MVLHYSYSSYHIHKQHPKLQALEYRNARNLHSSRNGCSKNQSQNELPRK